LANKSFEPKAQYGCGDPAKEISDNDEKHSALKASVFYVPSTVITIFP